MAFFDYKSKIAPNKLGENTFKIYLCPYNRVDLGDVFCHPQLFSSINPTG
jgi:hypothetical protein